MNNLAEQIKDLRDSKGLTQQQLGDRLHIKKGMISAYETSVRLPFFDVL
jgi:transcriptional regulator with XRE-family HTH domain